MRVTGAEPFRQSLAWRMFFSATTDLFGTTRYRLRRLYACDQVVDVS